MIWLILALVMAFMLACIRIAMLWESSNDDV